MSSTHSSPHDTPLSQYRWPADWTQDVLSYFLGAAQNNQLAAFVKERPSFDRLARVDAIFDTLAEGLREWTAKDPGHAMAYVFFLVRSHGAYRAACGLTAAGQTQDAILVLRGTLEAALYAFFFAKRPAMLEGWLNRQAGHEAKKWVRRELTMTVLWGELDTADPTFCQEAKDLYERTIDYGAHPNVYAVLSGGTVEDTSEDTSLSAQIEYFHTGESFHFKFAVLNCIQIGLASLNLLRLGEPEKFDSFGLLERLKKERPERRDQTT